MSTRPRPWLTTRRPSGRIRQSGRPCAAGRASPRRNRLSRVLHGPAGSGGAGTVDVQFNIKKKHATKVTRFEFSNIPATCRGFPPTAVSDTFAHKIAVAADGRFHATEKTNAGRVTYTVS